MRIEAMIPGTKTAALCLALAAIHWVLPAAAEPGGYPGQQHRAVKAMSPVEVRDLLLGKGMGMAKAAELNHFPGPRHVLDLAAELGLSDGQLARTSTLFARMQSAAASLGTRIVTREQELDSLFATNRIDSETLRSIVMDIGRLRGELRGVHLSAHLDMRKILSARQVAAYDRLRGYGGPDDRGPGPATGHGHGH